MEKNLKQTEQLRYRLQVSIDCKKDRETRNRLGQFSTPYQLAHDMIQFAETLLPRDQAIDFLDPAIGTGVFFSALLDVFPKTRIKSCFGFEIDSDYGKPGQEIWNQLGLTIRLSDFTTETPEPRFNLVICNPPYVRHHHLDSPQKARLQQRTTQTSGMVLSGLSGLYCYFMGLSHGWLAPGAISAWLVPCEFMDVNYGSTIKDYLLKKVTLLHIHRFNPTDVQFADALVSSAIVWFRNEFPPENHRVWFSYGGNLTKPTEKRAVPVHALLQERKWTRFPLAHARADLNAPILSDYFQIKRGIATGNNRFFHSVRGGDQCSGAADESLSPNTSWTPLFVCWRSRG